MKVLVFGAGALGTLLGAHVAQRFPVHLVGRQPHVDAVRRQGVRVTGSHEFTVECEASTEAPPHWIPDVAMIAVKAFDREAAIEGLAGRLGPRTTVVTVQNGLGNWERYRDVFADQTVLAASVVYGARLESPGHVVATGEPEILLGGAPEAYETAEALAEAFDHARLPTRPTRDVRGVLLAKALVNAAINPLTAIAGVPNGDLLEDGALRDRMTRICQEGQRLIERVDYDVPVDDLRARVDHVCRITAGNQSSMLQDIARGRRTEADAILGEVVELGRSVGLEMPETERAYEQIRRRERANRPQARRGP